MAAQLLQHPKPPESVPDATRAKLFFSIPFAPKLLLLGFAIAATAVCRSSFEVPDLLILTSVAAIVSRAARCAAAFTAILLWVAGFSLPALPTYWFCLAPLAWLCRTCPPKHGAARIGAETLVTGFGAAWFSTPFVRDALPSWGHVAHAIGCLLFGLQLGIVGVVLWRLRTYPVWGSAIIGSIFAVAGEYVQARFGVAWSVMALALPAAPTPIAQWAYYITPFGVSGILYLCNFLCLPDNTWNRRKKWIGPVFAVAVGAAAWASGACLASQVETTSLQFSAMLVQPHLRPGGEPGSPPWVMADQLTRHSLKAAGPVDLVVWPETSLAPSVEKGMISNSSSPNSPVTLQELSSRLAPEYGCACLAGVVLVKHATELKFGLEVMRAQSYNCGCLADRSGTIVCQEKMELIPLREGLAAWFDRPWIRSRLLPFFGVEAPFSRGASLQLLHFKSNGGKSASVAVPICYESFIPWLPYYRESESADAIVHLVYDGYFADHRQCVLRQQWACRYRAIETRKWNLVCTSWAGSCVISPAGDVVAEMASESGVLRTDQIDRNRLTKSE